MSVISTYMNDNAQTPLIDSLSIYYTSKFATNTVKSRTDGVYALVYRTYVVDRRRSYWSQLAAWGGEIFSKSTVAEKKWVTWEKSRPL